MSRNQRLALVVAALAVAVIAFVIASPGGDDDGGNSDSTEAVETAPVENTPTNTAAEPPPTPAAPKPVRIEVTGGQVQGGVRTIEVDKGDPVRIVISADAADELHLHGYDLTRTAEPGKPARFRFDADLEGVFELESHTAEDAGLPPAVAKLVVSPS